MASHRDPTGLAPPGSDCRDQELNSPTDACSAGGARWPHPRRCCAHHPLPHAGVMGTHVAAETVSEPPVHKTTPGLGRLCEAGDDVTRNHLLSRRKSGEQWAPSKAAVRLQVAWELYCKRFCGRVGQGVRARVGVRTCRVDLAPPGMPTKIPGMRSLF